VHDVSERLHRRQRPGDHAERRGASGPRGARATRASAAAAVHGGVQAADPERGRCGSDAGEIGALLRREGLYSSHLAAWRRQREEGILNALSPRRRGRPTSSPEQRELARLRQENERLGQRLVAAEAVIEIQKKVSFLLGLVEPSRPNAEHS